MIKNKTEYNFGRRNITNIGKNASSIRYENKDKVVTISTLITRRDNQTNSLTHMYSNFNNSN
jgi:hypothetical protein